MEFVFAFFGWLWLQIRYRNEEQRETVLKEYDGRYIWIGIELFLRPILVLLLLLFAVGILFGLLKVTYDWIITV